MQLRRRAWTEDRIRLAKDARLIDLPLHGFDKITRWCDLVLLATEWTDWTRLLVERVVS